MAVRTALLLSFIAGSFLGIAVFWWLFDSPHVSEAETQSERRGAEVAGSTAKEVELDFRERCSEDLERVLFELARERDAAARLSEGFEQRCTALGNPPPAPHGPRRKEAGDFDAGVLHALGFPPKDIDWIRRRWELSEIEKRSFAEFETRDEDPPRGGELADIERELHEDLKDNGYDAMLYATHQSNRVALQRVRNGSIAHRAGLRNGTVVWSYDGQRIFNAKQLAAFSTIGKRGEPVEIVIVGPEGNQAISVERSPLGADLVSAKAPPHPN
jgi:hypothetical protein